MPADGSMFATIWARKLAFTEAEGPLVLLQSSSKRPIVRRTRQGQLSPFDLGAAAMNGGAIPRRGHDRPKPDHQSALTSVWQQRKGKTIPAFYASFLRNTSSPDARLAGS